MIRDARRDRQSKGGAPWRPGVVATLTAALMLGACSQSAKLLDSASLSAPSETASTEVDSAGGDELQKATLYWGQEYAKRPNDLKTALNYARNLKAMGEKQKALSVLQQISVLHDGDQELAGEYGRLALELDQVGAASRLLAVADNPGKPDWKVISARGTVFAKQGDYKQAISAYERALALSNNQPSVLNNLAMAHAMSGNPVKAEELLRQASAVDGATPKVQQNLALVLGLQGRYEEAKTAVAFAPSSASDAVKSDTDLLRRVVKVEAKAGATPFATTTVVAASAAETPFATEVIAAPQATGIPLRPAISDASPTVPWQTTVADAFTVSH
jgi:Flp pilus assembly protein TadD